MNDKNQKASEMILNALNDVDDEMIEEAAPAKIMAAKNPDHFSSKDSISLPNVERKKKAKKSPVIYLSRNWKKLTAIAACLVIFVVGGSSAWRQVAQLKSDDPADYYDKQYFGSYNESVTSSMWDKENSEERAEEFEYSSNGLVSNDGFSIDRNPTGEAGAMPSVTQKLIYTANLRLETLEFDPVVREIKEKIAELGGFIESDEIYDSSNGVWFNDTYEKTKGTMTENIIVRIPADRYDEFLSAASGVNGKVTNLVQNVENITREYSDLSTTIQSLQTQENRLLEMLKEAETIEDMIYVESRLSEVQNELRIYQNHLNEMDMDVAYSTVYLKITEVVKYTNTPAPKSTFLERLQSTLSNSGEGFLNFLENTLFFVITVLPEVLLVGLVITVVVLIVKAGKKKKAVSGSDQSNKMDA